MLSADEVKKFKATRVGWISPTGELHAVSVYKHLEFLEQHIPEFAGMAARLNEEVSEIEQQQYDWMDANPDEHPAWHGAEIGIDSLKYEYRDAAYFVAYTKGWARVGLAKNNLYVETTKSAEQAWVSTVTDIAAILELKYMVELKKVPKDLPFFFKDNFPNLDKL